MNVWRYWELPETEVGIKIDESTCQDLVGQLGELLEDSVGHQLTADVPVGVLLSGGVDSSLIVAMAARSQNRVKTFTIRFPGHGIFDETHHARLISKHFGTEHIELEAQQETVDLIPLLARQFDEPMADSSMIPTFLVSQLVRPHCPVALGGDGGDELFGGYGHYSRLVKLSKIASVFPQAARSCIAHLAGRLLPVGFKGRSWLQAMRIDLGHKLPLSGSFFDRMTRARLMSNERKRWSLRAEGITTDDAFQESDIIQRATRNDFKNYLAEDILVKVDRSSMANSLEVRAPFLDYRIIEFGYSKVPSKFKVDNSERKILLKKLAVKLLPAEFNLSRKQGFSIPLAKWLKEGSFRELFHSVLLDEGCIFDRNTVISLLKGQDQGRSNSERLFALVFFELWRQEWRAKL
jgi:asparagine synthase (glutamine-hydrolysing)